VLPFPISPPSAGPGFSPLLFSCLRYQASPFSPADLRRILHWTGKSSRLQNFLLSPNAFVQLLLINRSPLSRRVIESAPPPSSPGHRPIRLRRMTASRIPPLFFFLTLYFPTSQPPTEGVSFLVRSKRIENRPFYLFTPFPPPLRRPTVALSVIPFSDILYVTVV